MLRPAVVLALIAAAWGHPSAQQTTFRAETELVNLGVTVTDRRGDFLTDLSLEEFEVFEDDRRQTIRFFAPGDGGTAPDLHVGLLFDTSGSMGQDIAMARSAAIRFLNRMDDAEDITIVDFDTEVRVGKYEQHDFPRIVDRIRSRKPDGMTAMASANGEPVRFDVITMDITERKRVEVRSRLLVAIDDAVRSLIDPEEITATCARSAPSFSSVSARGCTGRAGGGSLPSLSEAAPPHP